jgi:hypothetical protein
LSSAITTSYRIGFLIEAVLEMAIAFSNLLFSNPLFSFGRIKQNLGRIAIAQQWHQFTGVPFCIAANILLGRAEPLSPADYAQIKPEDGDEENAED